MRIIAFDVDETLECSGGPVPIGVLEVLRQNGDMVGICGNWALALRAHPALYRVVSFIGPMVMPKDVFLGQLKQYVPAVDYIMVGNILGVSGASDDQGAAHRACWTFVKEADWRELLP